MLDEKTNVVEPEVVMDTEKMMTIPEAELLKVIKAYQDLELECMELRHIINSMGAKQ